MSGHNLGLDGCRWFSRWWLRFDVIEEKESAAGQDIGGKHAALPVPGATVTLHLLVSAPVRLERKAGFALDSARIGSRRRRLSWAELLKRVFGIEALRCRHCGSKMCVLATIFDSDVAKRILACMKLPPRAPTHPCVLAPATGLRYRPSSARLARTGLAFPMRADRAL